MALTPEPWLLGLDGLVVPWHQDAGPSPLAAALVSALRWEPVDPGSPGPTDPRWVPVDTVVASRPDEDPVRELRGLVIVTTDAVTESSTIAEASVAGAGKAAGAATRMALRQRVRRLGMPLLGAGTTSLPPNELADAVVSATRIAITNSGPSSLTDVVFIVADADLLAFVQSAWAGYKTQAFTNDRPEGPDLLGVRDEVHALADMLLLREVTPPLAVGILGGWGSGKSFVMHLLRERMREIRCEVIAPGQGWDAVSGSPFVGHIYPIDFNAWTYARADLWAALMQRVLSELDRQIGIERRLATHDRLLDGGEWRRLTKTPAELHALYEQTAALSGVGPSLFETLREVHHADREKLEDATRQLHDLRGDVSVQVTAIERKVDRDIEPAVKEQLDRQALAPLAAIVDVSADQVRAWIREQAPELASAAEDATNVVSHVRALDLGLDRMRAPWQALAWKMIRQHWRLEVGAGIAIVVAVALVLVGLSTLGALTGVTTLLATLAGWLRAATALNAAFREQKERARQEVAREIRALETRREKEVASARLADDELQRKEKEIVQTESYLDHLRERVGLVGQYRSVGDLIRDRLERGTYTERLGVMQQISDDLTSLTHSLVVADEDPHAAEKQKLFPRGPARVVLFIDDIDRCPPRKVVEVLEAVQLLLSTNLFVVVLALDVRYVTKALEKVYAGVLSADGDPSGLDYLEKIIQIPYRTRRPTGDGALQFMAGQLRVAEAVDLSAGPAAGAAADRADSTQTIDTGDLDANAVARELLFTADDLVVVAACCRILELTPRAGKRVANAVKLFRLVWARRGQGRPDLQEIATVAMIVGMASAHPEVQRDALAVLERLMGERGERATTLLGALAKLEPPPGPPDDPEVRRYQRWHVDLEAFGEQPVMVGEQANQTPLVIGSMTLGAATSVINFVTAFCFVGDDLPRLNTAVTSGRMAGSGPT